MAMVNRRVGVAATLALAAVTTLGVSSCEAGSAGGSESPSSASYSVATIEPDTLIPGKSTDGELPLAALFTPLAGVDANGALVDLQAQSIESSSDAKTWVITIRKGWTFHNGEPVTAQSYVDAWNYNAYGPHAFASSGELANIVGYAALNPSKGKPTTTLLSGLKTLSTDAFQVRLTKPDSQFGYELTANDWAFYPLPQAAYKNLAAYNEKPIGDGPYQMNGVWHHDQSIAMTAYPHYAGANRPKTKSLVFKIFSSADTAYTDVLAGNTDIANVPADKLTQMKQDFSNHWFMRGGQSIEYLGFPLFDQRWQNKKLREAISLAIDRSAINKALFGGLYGVADSYLPPTTPGGDPHSCQYCQFDPSKARTLLAQAGGFTGHMIISYMGGYGLDQEYQAIANQLRQNLGINVTAQPSSTISAYITNLGNKTYRSGPLYGSASANFPSAESLLSPVFVSPGFATYFSDPTVVNLISDGNAAASAAAAQQQYRAAEARIETDFPAIPLFFPSLPMVYSKRVKNVTADALTNPIYTAITVSR